jgi:hypothetical protein
MGWIILLSAYDVCTVQSGVGAAQSTNIEQSNEWAFIKPVTQYNNKKPCFNTTNKKQWINEWAFINTMTPYNNQQRGPCFFCRRTHAIKK